MRFLGSNLPSQWITRVVLAIAVATMVTISPTQAQFNNNGFFGRGVGGVKIDADGVLRNFTEQDHDQSLQQLRAQLLGAQGELAKATDLRLISLSKLQQTVLKAAAENKTLPEEVLFLGGLTRVQYVFAFPERQDIVIAGPAEPWTVSKSGAVVGKQSGKPVVCLDDLLEAFKYVSNARTTGISVSIDPTEQGVRQLNNLLKNIGSNPDPSQLQFAVAQAFGPQQVSLSGVPADSHMAHVILAADYRMKLYGMNLAKAPVKGLPSYLEMIQNRGASAQLQSRFWMACDYNAIEHSKDNLAWSISGPGIKTLTEQEQINSAGQNKQTGKVDATAKKWTDLFTKKMEELSVVDPVFGELRNVMDLCVVAALIESQNLQSLAACDLTSIMGDSSKIELPKLEAARTLDPQVSLIQSATQGLLVSASGGVLIDSWQAVQNTKANESLADVRKRAENWSQSDLWYQ